MADPSLGQLQHQWLRTALLWLTAWIVAYLLLRSWPYTARWLLLSGLTLSFILWRLRQNLALNHRPEENDLLPVLGPGNQITLFRGLLLGLLAGFIFSPWPQGAMAWVIAGIYTLVSIADGIDGYVARRSNRVTELGQLLDIEYDGLGVAIVTLLAVGYGQLPAWFLLVGFARYLFVFGLWRRKRHGKAYYEMPASVHRRILAGMLMGMMTVVLWPILPPAMSYIAAAVIGIPVLLGFLRDWLFASGLLSSGNAVYERWRHISYLLLTCWLPPFWRILLVLAITTVMKAAEPWYRPAAWEMLLQSWGLAAAAPLATTLAATALLGTTFVALGILGRLFSVLLLLPIGFDISTIGLNWQNGLALVCVLMIVLFGSGPYSLWQPEEAFLLPAGGQVDAETRENNG